MLRYDQRINAGRFDETIVGREKPKMGESMKNFDVAKKRIQAIANLWFGSDVTAAMKAILNKRVELARNITKYFQAIANLWFGASLRKTINAIKRKMK